MKIQDLLEVIKPRNKTVPAMFNRSGAGAHGKTRKAQRRQDKNKLHRELKHHNY